MRISDIFCWEKGILRSWTHKLSWLDPHSTFKIVFNNEIRWKFSEFSLYLIVKDWLKFKVRGLYVIVTMPQGNLTRSLTDKKSWSAWSRITGRTEEANLSGSNLSKILVNVQLVMTPSQKYRTHRWSCLRNDIQNTGTPTKHLGSETLEQIHCNFLRQHFQPFGLNLVLPSVVKPSGEITERGKRHPT